MHLSLRQYLRRCIPLRSLMMLCGICFLLHATALESGDLDIGDQTFSTPVQEMPGEQTDWVNEFEATAYCDTGITKSGVWTKVGVVAADPLIIPLGSVIEVRASNYAGIYQVLDTGALVKGRIIDIYMPGQEEATAFGRQRVQVSVLHLGYPDSDITELISPLNP